MVLFFVGLLFDCCCRCRRWVLQVFACCCLPRTACWIMSSLPVMLLVWMPPLPFGRYLLVCLFVYDWFLHDRTRSLRFRRAAAIIVIVAATIPPSPSSSRKQPPPPAMVFGNHQDGAGSEMKVSPAVFRFSVCFVALLFVLILLCFGSLRFLCELFVYYVYSFIQIVPMQTPPGSFI